MNLKMEEKGKKITNSKKDVKSLFCPNKKHKRRRKKIRIETNGWNRKHFLNFQRVFVLSKTEIRRERKKETNGIKKKVQKQKNKNENETERYRCNRLSAKRKRPE